MFCRSFPSVYEQKACHESFSRRTQRQLTFPEGGSSGFPQSHELTLCLKKLFSMRQSREKCLLYVGFVAALLPALGVVWTMDKWTKGEMDGESRGLLFPLYIFLAVFTKGPLGFLIPFFSTAAFIFFAPTIRADSWHGRLSPPPRRRLPRRRHSQGRGRRAGFAARGRRSP